jgi:hypothetical protein
MHERLDTDVAVKARNVDYALALGWMWNVRGRNDAMRIETSEKLNSFLLSFQMQELRSGTSYL